MRRFLAVTLLSLSALGLAGCEEPLPDERQEYAGVWEGGPTHLTITRAGRVDYHRSEAGASTSLQAPINGWDGDSFSAGVGPLSADFSVERAPHREADGWHMTVDGVELVRQ